MYAMLCNADTDEELHLLNDGKTRYTSGSCVSCLYHLKDIDGSHQGFFVFPDLSIRVEGRYRLKLCLFETIGHSVHHCKSIYSDPFHVYTAKRFPGMEESTRLSKSFAEQGLKVRVRKHPRSRRRGSKRAKDESDASDDAPLARDRASPKRARVSDIVPSTSGLPMPQPVAPSMPRSMDATYERAAEYERKPLVHDIPGAPARRSGWEEAEAIRIHDHRSYDSTRYEHAYAPHARDERLPPPRDLDPRYINDYPPPSARIRQAAAPHPSMRYATEYPPAYIRDDGPLPPPLSATPPPSSMRAGGGGYGDSILPPPPPPPFVAAPPPHARPYPSAPAPIPTRPVRAAARSYAEHAYDDYRYTSGGSYRLTPASPEYSRRSPYQPAPAAPRAQWSGSGPPSPSRPGEYEYRRSPPPRPLSGAYAGEAAYRRGGYPERAAYDGGERAKYGRDEKFAGGAAMLGVRDQPVLPPLAAGTEAERFLPPPPPVASGTSFRPPPPPVDEWDDRLALHTTSAPASQEYRTRPSLVPSRPPSRPY